MLGLFGSRSLPRGGSQLTDAVGGPLAEFGQDILEIVSEVDVQATAGFHNGGDGRDLGTGFRTADVQPVLAAKGQGTNRPFAPVMPPRVPCRVAA